METLIKKTEEITRDNYYSYPGVGSNYLADFNIAPDVALNKTFEPKDYFEIGNIFENYLEQSVKNNGVFDDRYIVTEIEGNLHENALRAVKEPDLLDDLIANITNKDGSIRKTSVSQYKQLEFLQKNPGKIPITKDTFDEIKKMYDNFMRMHIQHCFNDIPLAKLLRIAEFQKPIAWNDTLTGVECKALIDIYIEFENIIYIFDIKTTASKYQFFSSFSSRYWIQDRHYINGVKTVSGKEVFDKMTFLVSPKDEFHIAQSFALDDRSVEYADDAYKSMMQRFKNWLDEGKPAKGWSETEYISKYFN